MLQRLERIANGVRAPGRGPARITAGVPARIRSRWPAPAQTNRTTGGRSSGPQLEGLGDAADEEDDDEAEPSFFADPKRLIQTARDRRRPDRSGSTCCCRTSSGSTTRSGSSKKADWIWITVALAFNVLAFGSYVALFRGVVGESDLQLRWSESYQITMAGLAATRLFSAGGAGGIVLTYWALRKAGMPRRQSACRMVAFLVLLYAVYMLTLVIDGILLRTGVINGNNPPGLTIVPAAIAGAVIVVFLLIALLPEDFERRMTVVSHGRPLRAADAAARDARRRRSASGTRTAIDFVRNPSRGGLAIAGAIGFWASNIGILWAAFHAFDVHVPLGVVIQGFFVGMVANLIPFVPGGVGAVDAGHDRHLRPLRPARQRGVRRGARLPADRVLAADPAGDRRLLPAAPDGRPLGAGAAARRGRLGRGRVTARPVPPPSTETGAETQRRDGSSNTSESEVSCCSERVAARTDEIDRASERGA